MTPVREAPPRPQIDRELLRTAAEHVGALAERAKEQHELYNGRRGASWTANQFYKRYARLYSVAQGLLEIANE